MLIFFFSSLETFDEDAVSKANAGDAVLESELTALSQDLEKTEERLTDLSAQAKETNHHKVCDMYATPAA